MLASLLPLQQRLYATYQATRLAALPLRGSLRALQKSMASTEMKGCADYMAMPLLLPHSRPLECLVPYRPF